ncbi:MAG: hypothetical protein LW707_05250, partial [Sphingobacteriales bacterium]|nr:hypothetical protein [Sphingobacteriales bacterium]
MYRFSNHQAKTCVHRKYAFIAKALLVLMLSTLAINAQAQLLTQDFNFSGALTSNGFTAHSGGGTNALSTTTGLTYTGHAGSGIGNAVLVNNLGGEDANITFTSTTGPTVYYSFLVNVTDPASAKSGDVVFHVGSPGGAGWTAFAGRVSARIVSGNVNFGISNTSTATYGTTNFSKNTTYLIVVKHSIVTGATADPLSMWVIPSGMPATEAVAGTAELTNTTTNGTDAISAVGLRQGSATNSPQVVVDAIRVGASWGDVMPLSSVPLSVSSSSGTIACAGGSTTVTVSASGGLPPYTGTGTFTAQAGAYSYTVTDANGNTAVASGSISDGAAVTSNTTTATACGSYTWSVNGVTYTQSGTYSSVSVCHTETLSLTVTP